MEVLSGCGCGLSSYELVAHVRNKTWKIKALFHAGLKNNAVSDIVLNTAERVGCPDNDEDT